jgi:hypothetical protein
MHKPVDGPAEATRKMDDQLQIPSERSGETIALLMLLKSGRQQLHNGKFCNAKAFMAEMDE